MKKNQDWLLCNYIWDENNTWNGYIFITLTHCSLDTPKRVTGK